jgi:hypothetical protein
MSIVLFGIAVILAFILAGLFSVLWKIVVGLICIYVIVRLLK